VYAGPCLLLSARLLIIHLYVIIDLTWRGIASVGKLVLEVAKNCQAMFGHGNQNPWLWGCGSQYICNEQLSLTGCPAQVSNMFKCVP
jgi:hypothetical protein